MRRTRSARSGPPRRRSSYAAFIQALATEATSGWILAGSGGAGLGRVDRFRVRKRSASGSGRPACTAVTAWASQVRASSSARNDS